MQQVLNQDQIWHELPCTKAVKTARLYHTKIFILFRITA
jgi:hypothetical protein